MVAYFNKYNSCKGNPTTEKKAASYQPFHIQVKPGIDYSSLSVASVNRIINFSAKANPRLGLSLEFVLPFHKNKWAAFVEPAYSKYNAYELVEGIGVVATTDTVTVRLRGIELPIGLKHILPKKRAQTKPPYGLCI